ncbi:MarR family winged helix-turn-helix transcriptional regulator [Planctomicrobium sp. SH661]|uniref:MarR family winged helix-turn-helix transcriptional regulator n=1 Tax=Planctomicrobium sp. SH661 TaxID=3448124 RepID=UPI003F5B76A8
MTSHLIRKLLSTSLAPAKMTLRQFEVLATLAKLPGCGSQTEIADALGIEPHTLAGVLKRMERDGLLERTCCDQDRRKNRVQPTAKAEEMWQRATAISHAIRRDIIQGLTGEDLAMLKSICQRLQTNILAAEAELEMQPAVHHSPPHAPAHLAVPFSPMIHP